MKIRTTIICLILSFSSYCQTTALIRGGVNHSTLFYSEESELEPFSTHVHFGFGVEWSLSKNTTFLAESLFSVKGHNDLTDGSMIPEIPKHLHLNYFSVPLSLNFKLKSPLKLKIGGEIDYLMFKKVHFSNDDFTKGTKRYDLGILGGLRYPISGYLEIGISYFHGLVKVIEWSDTQYFKNRNFQLHCGYVFD